MGDKDTINEIFEKFKALNEDDKKELAKKLRYEWPFFDYPNYENPVTTKENIKELQEKMVQLCIDYINENNLTDIEEIQFSADELQFSSKEGMWTPQTDSFIYIYGHQKESGSERVVRKLIGDYF